jgi:chitodextrinase
VRIESFNGVSCDRNEIESNSLTDDQAVPTQTYGINIADPECTATVIGSSNSFSGNRLGDIKDNGTGTVLPGDSTAPSVPTNVVATATSGILVDVTWSASTDNVGVDGYAVYRDGIEVGTVDGATTTFADGTVAPNTSYQYTVDAFDAAGNRSAQSSPPASVTTPGPPSSITQPAEADSYVHASNPNTNYGTSTQLRTDGSPEILSYVRFTVNTGGAAVDTTSFRIRADSNHSQGFTLVAVADNSWGESTVDYSTAPVTGAVVGSSGPLSAGQIVDIDVSGYVTAEGTYSFALVPITNTNMRLSSRETGVGPELVVSLL